MLPLVLVLAGVAQAAASQPVPPEAREIAADTWLLPGAMYPDRGPDGNTVVLVGPSGLVVIDTGRHPSQSDGIVAFARQRGQPVVAIVNTHWHLDHSSGNRRVKAVYPGAKVYTTPAVDRALAPGGFLARALASAHEHPSDPDAPAVRREEQDLFLATMDASDSLRPDVAVTATGPLVLAGRPLAAHVTDGAVTDADLWLYDEATHVAIVGDLVTLPAPFFETACPARWQAELDAVWQTPFTQAVPGHGLPMTRTAFDTYRKAFAAFRSCVGRDAAADVCAAAWAKDVATLLPSEDDRRMAADYAGYYVGFLRKNGGASPDCVSK